MFTEKNRYSQYFAVLSLFALVFITACVIGQKWSENYALMDGARSNDPQIIDGNLNTYGVSQILRTSGSFLLDVHLPTEAIVLLPEQKTLFRVEIYSSNLQEFQLMARNSKGGWDQIHEQKSSRESVLDIRLNPSVTTNAIKLVVRKTSDDAAQKRKNLKLERENQVTPDGKVRRGQQVYKIYGPIKAPAKIAEIKLFGYTD
jgi:hypothetical protein